ncbi:cbp/p300-interacting transactivator 1-like [Chroicocephalus ridibundus]|uniref:cbp/p300-interacting transactivator 1-like n=1 Tax=Chroicocephalus ridibundus TaxID=1192867 RepID=UPI002FDD1EDD
MAGPSLNGENREVLSLEGAGGPGRDELATVAPSGDEGPRGGGDSALPRRQGGRQAAGLRRGGSVGPHGPLGPAGGSSPPGQRAPPETQLPAPPRGEGPATPEPGSLPGWGAGSRPPTLAVGPGIIDSDTPDEEVLRALVLELSLDAAGELPELWLSHHEFDLPADLPAGC